MNNLPHGIFANTFKGTLHYVLQSSRFDLDEAIKFQFANDIATGKNMFMKTFHTCDS